MLVGADLYPCYSHTLSPLPRRLTSGGASVTIRPLIWLLLNRLAKYELRRMFSPKGVCSLVAAEICFGLEINGYLPADSDDCIKIEAKALIRLRMVDCLGALESG